MTSTTIWMDGTFRPSSDPHVNLLDQALHYGTGVFEGIRVYNTPAGPAVFRLDDHLAHLAKGARCLGFEADLEGMRSAVGPLHERGLRDAYVRPVAWLGGGSLKLDVTAMTPRHAVAVLPWNQVCEATGENVFMVHGDSIVAVDTPKDIVHGRDRSFAHWLTPTHGSAVAAVA
ncbi:MAG: aminotransferase class IV [Myxococcota bacterium]